MYILLLFHTGLNSNSIALWHSISSQVQVGGQDQGLTLRSRISFKFFAHSFHEGLNLIVSRPQMSQLVAETPAKGRKRKPWVFVGLEEVASDVSLRKASQQWLQKQNVLHKPLTNSSHNHHQTMIGRCHACEKCDKQYCFSWDTDGRLKIEETGSCNNKKNTAVLKRARAKAYAHHSPAQAVKLMRRAGIPEDEIPDQNQVKNQRYSLSKDNKLPVVPVDCLDDLRSFLANPPEKMLALEDHMILSEERIVIPFCLKSPNIQESRLWLTWSTWKTFFYKVSTNPLAISNPTWFIWEKTGRMEMIAVSNVRPTSFYPGSKSFVPIQSMTGSSFLPSRFHLTSGAMTSTWLLLLGTISKQPPVWCSSKTAKGKRFNLYSGLFVGYVLNFNLRMKRILGSRVPQPRIKFKQNEDRMWQWESREAYIQI